MNKFSRYSPWGMLLLTVAVFFYALILVNWSVKDLFITPDQRGRLLLQKKEYKQAAVVFQDPMRRGTALYRNGDFKEAAAAFGREDSAEAHYNRANALLMVGKYDEAIAAYEQALGLKPDWLAARGNLALARIRKKRMLPPDDVGGTGGKLEADAIVFDDRAKKAAADQQEQVAGGEGLSALEMRALWLRRIENRPADFLRAKFLYQKKFSRSSGTHRPEKKRD